jgi:hypothetical protein
MRGVFASAPRPIVTYIDDSVSALAVIGPNEADSANTEAHAAMIFR